MHIYNGITPTHVCRYNKVMMLAAIYLKVTALNLRSEIASDKFSSPTILKSDHKRAFSQKQQYL